MNAISCFWTVGLINKKALYDFDALDNNNYDVVKSVYFITLIEG